MYFNISHLNEHSLHIINHQSVKGACPQYFFCKILANLGDFIKYLATDGSRP